MAGDMEKAERNRVLEAALGYASLGWKVLPLKKESKEPDGSLVPNGVKDASSDETVIRQWWERNPKAGVGIATGLMSGIVVVDIDTQEEDAISRYLPAMAEATPIVRTGRGYHIYFKAPSDLPKIPNIVRVEGKPVDIKGDGGYVVAPPTRHPETMQEYEWVYSPLQGYDLAECPDWLYVWLKSRVGNGGGLTAEDIRRMLGGVPEGERNVTLTRLLGKLFRHMPVELMDVVGREVALSFASRCEPPLDEKEALRVLQSIKQRELRRRKEEEIQNKSPSGRVYSVGGIDVGTDAFNAYLFAKKLKGKKVLYTEAWGWTYWNGRQWVRDSEGAYIILVACNLLRRYYTRMAIKFRDSQFLKLRKKALGTVAVRNLLHMARGLCSVPVEELDKPGLLNASNGVVDLRTGELKPHAPEWMLTKLCPTPYVEPTPEQQAQWQKFLSDITCGDERLAEYLQMVIGYGLTGEATEQKVFFVYGTGANGKSTFFEALAYALGDYAYMAPTDIIAIKEGRLDTHPTLLAQLAGRRLVVCSETEDTHVLNAARVKLLSGIDKVAARFLFRNYFTFKPTHTLFIMTNHLPIVRDLSEGIWRRIVIVPFLAVFPEDRADKQLLERLKECAPAILRWAVEGARKWYEKRRLPVIPQIEKYIREYRLESDSVVQFLRECCHRVEGEMVPFSELYNRYITWCELEREHPVSKKAFGNRLTELGFPLRRSSHIRYRLHIRVKEPYQKPQSDKELFPAHYQRWAVETEEMAEREEIREKADIEVESSVDLREGKTEERERVVESEDAETAESSGFLGYDEEDDELPF